VQTSIQDKQEPPLRPNKGAKRTCRQASKTSKSRASPPQQGREAHVQTSI